MTTDFDDTVQMMVDSLNDEAKQYNVNLKGLSYDNFNTFLDDAFDDGGYVRCECFGDIAMDYALEFGKIDSTAFAIAQHDCIKAAIEKVAEQWKDAHYKWANPFEWLKQANVDPWAFVESVADADDIQDFFQSDMEQDGYFDLVLD